MVPLAEDRDGVTGEVWAVDADGLKWLDELEGLAIGLYRRERVPLLAALGDATVEAYIYAQPTAGLADIGSTWHE
jgi:gamma-glutamylcyclotransferase (GGCT)/AIG2-like uncharacterized protein YtfP